MGVNYNDERLVAVKQEEQQTLNDNNAMYNDMIKDSQDYYNAQIDASKDYVEKQSQLQQEQTDFAIDKIEQQKDQANKDYVKEQSGAYVDWQKESNRYGANAEEMAASGFVASGYGESSQVRMFNQYQNRVATARESFNKIILNYDNNIKDAQLQNSSALAEIAYKGLQQQLELALQGLQYKNQLLETQANKQLEIKNMYQNKWQSVLNQINTENALAEEIRQYNESLAEEQRQFNASHSLQQQQLAEEKRQFDAQNTPVYLDDDTPIKINSVKAGNGSPNKAIAQFGTFSNGYQPKGIIGYGEVDKTGLTISVNGKTQNVWQTPDGTRWYWDGSVREYKQMPKESTGGYMTTNQRLQSILNKK